MAIGLEGLAYPQFQPPPGRYSQYANEVLDYAIDWLPGLAEGDIVVSSTWSTEPGLTLSDDSFTDSSATVWVSGGKPDYEYLLLNTIVTDGGRTTDGKLYIRIKRTPT